MSENRTVRLAVAQTTERNDPRNVDELRQGGRELRRLMREAHEAGARIVHFSEGTICWPHKLVMSVDGPDKLGPADWSRVEWDVLRAELAETAALAGKLKLWTVVGSVHQLTPPNRPYNSMYVISDKGTVDTRYDERTLSYTKITYMYTPGSEPITFEVDGLRFGCALGMDVHFPELFIQYERLGVHCVLLSTAGSAPHNTTVATEAQGHAAANAYWVSFAVNAQHSKVFPSGVVSPRGEWATSCPQDGTVALTLIDVVSNYFGDIIGPLSNWRSKTRTDLANRGPVPEDTRSLTRTGF